MKPFHKVSTVMRQQIQDPVISQACFSPPGNTTLHSNDNQHGTASTFYNIPSPSEKLTDGTLPLTWPASYLDHVKTEELVSQETEGQVNSPLGNIQEDYVQLMRTLQSESLVAQHNVQVDKVLHSAHHVSTLIAALAFIAVTGMMILSSLPTLPTF